MIAIGVGVTYLLYKIIRKVMKVGLFLVVPIFMANIYELRYITSIYLMFIIICIAKNFIKDLGKTNSYLSLSSSKFKHENLGKLVLFLFEINSFLFIGIVYINFISQFLEAQSELNVFASTMELFFLMAIFKLVKSLVCKFTLKDSKLKLI